MEWPPPSEAHRAPEHLPLAGVKVLDLSRIVAGPWASMILGDLGADVIKVEQPGAGDEPRRWGPPFHGDLSAYFIALNRNKRSLAVDLTTVEGRQIVAALCAAADVVVENYLPEQARRLGIEEMRAETSAVWVSVRAAGSDGPDGAKPGVDAAVQARSGLTSVNGSPACGPTKVGVPIVDMTAGLFAAVCALAGLRSPRTGPGRHFEVPLLECGVAALLNQAANYLASGEAPRLLGNEHPNVVPYGPFPTADGQIFFAATSDAQFVALCQLLGCPDLAEREEYASNRARIEHRELLKEELDAIARTRGTRTWLEAADRAGVVAAPVNSVAQAIEEDPQITAVGLVQEVTTAAGPVRLVGSPVLVDGRRPPVRSGPPELGEHTTELLKALGHPDPEIAGR